MTDLRATDLLAVRASHRRLVDWLEALDAPAPTMASELPGWTVGHVMTHIARNADGFTRMFDAACRGEVGDQYEGGRAGREAEIEAGAARSWDVLVADVVDSNERLERAAGAVPDEVWAVGQGALLAGTEPLSAFPHRRVREVEIHRLDLGLGATTAEWTEAFVAREWPLSVARLAGRLQAPTDAVLLVVDDGESERIGRPGAAQHTMRGTRTELLAWITGRRHVDGAPALASWP